MKEVVVKVYDGVKYDADSVKVAELILKGIVSTEVLVMTDDEMSEQGFDEFDPYGEYCVLTDKDGRKSTYRNSYVDCFCW